MTMTYALVQKLPPEALGEDERCGAVDVLAVGTQAQLEGFLEDYRRRLVAAYRDPVRRIRKSTAPTP
jgi:hypothetical protein